MSPMETIGRLNALIEVLTSSPRRVNKVFVDRDGRSSKIHEVVVLARRAKVPLRDPGRACGSY